MHRACRMYREIEQGGEKKKKTHPTNSIPRRRRRHRRPFCRASIAIGTTLKTGSVSAWSAGTAKGV